MKIRPDPFLLRGQWAPLDTVLGVAGKVVARASSPCGVTGSTPQGEPAGSGGGSPRESNPTMRPRSETLRELAAGDGCATRTVLSARGRLQCRRFELLS
jgi:hypothetical protein